MELAEIVMNPVRQRIFQYLLLHETGTVKEIRKALPDVPGASLYRHMKLLTESGILTVVGENRIRGTVESIYSLNKSALEIDDDGTVVQTALLGLSASFARYFSGGGADPRRDMLLMTTCTLTLTDEEFTGFLTEINQTALLPEGCVRVLVTAGLATIKERFAARMHGNLPAPVAAMLERKYGRFETEAHDLRVDTDAVSAEKAANEIRLLLNRGERDAQN